MQEDCTSCGKFVCRFAGLIAAGLPLTGNICANKMPVLIPPIPAASYFEQGIIHLLLSLPQLTLWPTAVSWTPPPPASSIKYNAPSGASRDFSVGCIYN